MPGPDDQAALDAAADPEERRLRGRVRLIAAGTFIALLSILALADTFGGPSGIHVSDFIFGSLLGGLLLTLSVEGAAQLVRKR